jgi:protein-L-isoaspartate(D-aspartate) O-methyltransferase
VVCDDPAELMHGLHTESRTARRALVEKLQTDGHLRSERVAAAIEAVPRELFVPGLPLDEVYRPSDAIVTKRVDGVSVSSASAPEVIALMLEQLDPQPGNRVLEIGAGTGYNAALLAYLVGDTGQVVTVDIDEDLVVAAREHLGQIGYGQVKVVQSDGALGYANGQAYDRIILTVASTDIAPAWRDQLARPHGRLVMPLGLGGLQRCVAFSPEEGYLVSRSLANCSFIALRGVLAFGSARIPLGPDGTRLLIGASDELPLSREAIEALLEARARLVPSGIMLTGAELREGLHLWLVAHLPNAYMLWGGASVPDLFHLDRSGAHGTLCVMDSHSVVVLARADDMAELWQPVVLTPNGGEALARQLVQLLRAWDAAGRPMDSDVELRAYPVIDRLAARPGETAIDQRWTRFVLNWSGVTRLGP